MENNKQSYKIPKQIISQLEEISNLLFKSRGSADDFGQKAFERYIELIREFGTVTAHEISNSQILVNLLSFLTDNLTNEKPTIDIST